MTSPTPPRIAVLGTGAMGTVLAEALLAAGATTTVWNRTPERAAGLGDAGAHVAPTVSDAVSGADAVVVCLFDHASVRATLEPVAAQLAGRAVVNVTTTTPAESRDLAAWADAHEVPYLDGGIMATPEMIGQDGALLLFSGASAVFEAYEDLLARWGQVSYLGDDAGLASLQDLAMLAPMYTMFAGFLHGAAMVASAGVSAVEHARRTQPFIAAMTEAFEEFAEIVDARDYAGEGQQSLEFTDLSDLLQASEGAGVALDVVAPVQRLIERQIAAGHGKEGWIRIYEELRR